MAAINTLEIYRALHPSFNEEQAKKLVTLFNTVTTTIQEEVEKRQFEKLATTEDLLDLKRVVLNLAKAQEKTEQRLNQLAIAQEKTEERLNQLVMVQEKTEQRLDQLVAAQEKTEKELQKLTKAVVHLQSEVGGLSNRFGYILEDRAIKTLPRLLKQDFDIEIKTMIRDFIEYDEKHFDEINILGYGQKNNQDILVIGEAKYQLANKYLHQFLVMLDRIKTVKKESLFPLFVCASADPSVRKYAEGLGIKLYYSYQLDL